MTQPTTNSGRRSHTWKKLRKQRLTIAATNHEPCRRCGQPIDYTTPWRLPNGKINRGYPVCGHINDVVHTGQEIVPLDQLAPEHFGCSARAGRALQVVPGKITHPTRPDLIHQVSGPPCAGKSTHITHHAPPDATVLDDNQLATQHGGRDRIPETTWSRWNKRRAHTARTWTGPGQLWFTRSDPNPLIPGSHIHLIDPGPTTCHQRAHADGRPEVTHQWIDDWYARHTPTAPPMIMNGAGVGVSSARPTSGPAAEQFSLPVIERSRRVAAWLPVIPVPPRLESPIPPTAAGSWGPAVVAWCEQNWPETPLPWQAYVLGRALEHDADGRLLHRRVGVSVPRQVGKSVLLRMLAWWRINQERMFGEPQTVLHVAHRLNTTEEVFAPAMEWARDLGARVREANGQMRVQVGDNRWVPRSTQTGYGFTLSLALVDEAWAVSERRVNSGYAPTLSARRNGQLWMFSTANEEATPLFPRFRESARDGWLMLEWSAAHDAQVEDFEVWQRATPVPIDETRRALMADECAANAATFAVERLNAWPASAGLRWGQVVAAQLPAASPVSWRGPLVGAVESDPGGVSWGVAVSDGDRVEVAAVPRVGEAVAWLRARAPLRVLAHQAVVGQLAGVEDLRVEPVSRVQAASATAVLRDAAGSLAWSGVLADQLGHAAVVAPGGVEQIDALASTGAVAGVKAASWCLWSARADRMQPAAIY